MGVCLQLLMACKRKLEELEEDIQGDIKIQFVCLKEGKDWIPVDEYVVG
jgi:hypothetical protein